MNDPEYFGNERPRFDQLDLDKALACIPIYMDIERKGRFARALSWFHYNPLLERGTKRSQIQAASLISRFVLYQDSHEFVTALDLQEDFHIHNSIANMHLWLIQ